MAEVVRNLAFRDYLHRPEVSQSTLKKFRVTARHGQWGMNHPMEPTDSTRIGHALHSLVLEERHDYMVLPGCNRRTKEGKAIYAGALAEAEEKGVPLLKKNQVDQVLGMVEGLHENACVADFLGEIDEAEVSVFWYGMKARLDGVGKGYIFDLKTTRDASDEEFSRAIWKYGYHIQAAHYLEAARAAGFDAETFVILAVENVPPYCARAFFIDITAIRIGEIELEELKARYFRGIKTGSFPGYPEDGAHPVGVPFWAARKFEKEINYD